MKKQLIRLTEEDLSQIIESTVHRIITENSENETTFDALRSFFGQYKNRGKQKAKELGKAAGNAMKSGYNTASQKMQNMGKAAGNAMKSGYNTASQKMQNMGKAVGNAVKSGYNTASLVGKDINNTWDGAARDGYMKDMQRSLDKFKHALSEYLKKGGTQTQQLSSQISGIQNMINSYQPNY